MAVLTKSDEIFIFDIMVAPFHSTMLNLMAWLTENTEEDLIVTSGFRDDPDSVHGTVPCRGVDIRSWSLEDPQGLVDKINSFWEYDQSRPDMFCAMLHDTGKGMHIHLQTHPNTKLIGKGMA